MKEYKYKINGNVYKVTVGNVEGNIAEVEVNGTRYKVEMEKAPEPKPVVVKPVVRQAATTPAPQATQVSKPAAARSTPVPRPLASAPYDMTATGAFSSTASISILWAPTATSHSPMWAMPHRTRCRSVMSST